MITALPLHISSAPVDKCRPLTLPFTRPLPLAGVERLKDALTALGLKAGGTPAERAARLFLTKSTPLEALDRKHFVKGAAAPRSEAEAKKQEEVSLRA